MIFRVPRAEMTFRILVTGARDWPERLEPFVHAKILGHAGALGRMAPDIIRIVEGECPAGGVDLFARRCGEQAGFLIEPYPANWRTLGKKAGNLRNTTMVEAVVKGIEQGDAGLCLAFPTPTSRGTIDCLTKAWMADIETHVYPLAVAERWARHG